MTIPDTGQTERRVPPLLAVRPAAVTTWRRHQKDGDDDTHQHLEQRGQQQYRALVPIDDVKKFPYDVVYSCHVRFN
jgi:hypothetical protein